MRRAAVALALLVASAAPGAVWARPAHGPIRGEAFPLERVVVSKHEVPVEYGDGVQLACGPVGGVRVVGWRESKVAIEARIELHGASEADLDELAKWVAVELDPRSTTLAISTRTPDDKPAKKKDPVAPKRVRALPWRVDYVVRVPEFAAVELAITDGDAIVSNTSGFLSITAIRSAVELTNVDGQVRLSVVAGSASIDSSDRSWRGSGLDATVTKGEIRLTLPANYNAFVEASAGDGVTFARDGEAPATTPSISRKLGQGGARLKISAPAGKAFVTLAGSAEPARPTKAPVFAAPTRP